MDDEKTDKTCGPETKPQPECVFQMKKDGTCYLVSLHFSKTASETLEDKMRRLIQQDVKDGKV